MENLSLLKELAHAACKGLAPKNPMPELAKQKFYVHSVHDYNLLLSLGIQSFCYLFLCASMCPFSYSVERILSSTRYYVALYFFLQGSVHDILLESRSFSPTS